MRRLVLLLLFALIFVASASAAKLGCCCDPSWNTGSVDTYQNCTALGYYWIDPGPFTNLTCDIICSSYFANISAPVCGDGVCDAGENATNCPQDCYVVLGTGGCADPQFDDPPMASVSPVKGELALKVEFYPTCPVSMAVIERCKGSGCTNFVQVKEVYYGNFWVDDSNLEWDEDYSYRVYVKYLTSKNSQPAVKSGNTGDIECFGKGDEEFCINSDFYDSFKSYLTSKGYGSKASFSVSNFVNDVQDVFGAKFNKAFECDDENVLLPGPSGVDCDSNEVCAAGSAGARCLAKTDCSSDDLFGLFDSLNSCEGVSTPKACFFDKSHTVVDSCYQCRSVMSCYDYKTEEACERDNCGAGFCEWHPINDDANTGVCVDTTKSNCVWCDKTGTAGVKTRNVPSYFEICTLDKSLALSTVTQPCFYDAADKDAVGCDDAYCQMYAPSQCGSPSGGIELNGANKVTKKSADPCGIGVCQLIDAGAGVQICVKNADGSSSPVMDCDIGDGDCERDYFPPVTEIYTAGPANRVDYLNIRVFDKTSKAGEVEDRAGDNDYITKMCIKDAPQACKQASAFGIDVNSAQLIVHDLNLKEGVDVLADLREGYNTIVYYSVDPNKNLEQVKEIEFYACSNCSGPIFINASVTSGRLIQDTFYTSAKKPTFSFRFDEPAKAALFTLKQGSQQISTKNLNSGWSNTLSFSSTANLNGNYTVTLNAYNKKDIYLDQPLTFNVVADPSAGQVAIQPVDGSVIDTSAVDIRLTFSVPVALDKVLLKHDPYSDPLVAVLTSEDITSDFSTNDNRVFTASVSGLTAGRYIISVDAESFGNKLIFADSEFFKSSLTPKIRLKHPSFGIVPLTDFNITVETSEPAECRYLWDAPSAPDDSEFNILNAFTGTTTHVADGFYIPFGSSGSHYLHVLCDFDGNIVTETFDIYLDSSRPSILSAFAEPEVIAEPYSPGTGVYVTTLKVELNKEGFCRYSDVTSSYNKMEGEFPGYGYYPKESHSADVNVTEEDEFDYFVVCEGLNGLKSDARKVEFSVDTSLDFEAKSTTPEAFGSRNITLGIVTNKKAFCYYGTDENAISDLMGSASFTHRASVMVGSSGRHRFFAECFSGTSERSGIMNITVYVDTTDPDMLYVNDSSPLISDPDVSWFSNKLQVAFLGEDDESGISHYLVSLRDDDDNYLFDDAPYNRTDGEPFYINTDAGGASLNLENGTTYTFEVKAVNKVDLESDYLDSDGVTVDTSLTPPECNNLVLDNDETDIDCGGPNCDACAVGKDCLVDGDCNSNFCYYGICTATSCTDDIRNGFESDVDCGGTVCASCGNNKSCVANTDCVSNYCNDNNRCADAPACADGVLSTGETDIDCGGPCAPCGNGKNCVEDSDCAAGLSCDPVAKVCASGPVGPPTIEDPSQVYSLGDRINDAWRLRYFGCVECPEAAGDADPDRDGLSNLEEFDRGTDPNSADTDGDGWDDAVEISKGYDPLNPDSYPSSLLGSVLKVLLWLLLIVGLVFGAYVVWPRIKPLLGKYFGREKKAPPAAKAEGKPAREYELDKLREFARKEVLPDKDWIPLKKIIEKKPLAKKEFEHELDELRKFARKHKKDLGPLESLREMLKELPAGARHELYNRYRLMDAGVLSHAEVKELLAKLKVTAEYYKAHKDELEKELKRYVRK